jgi:mannose-1-phosphate guanylyltransferase
MEYALILAGGRGERFWPLSRQNNPKQLLAIFTRTKRTLLEEAIERAGKIVPGERIKIITSPELKRRICARVKSLTDDDFILEPYAKNTAPAIAFAAQRLIETDPDALMYIFPSDHIIRDEQKFLLAVATAREMIEADEDGLVLIGIKPNRPETGYGYIELEPFEHNGFICNRCYSVKAFKEKPSRPLAQEFLLDKRHYWNSGIFVWKAKTILKYVEELMPELHRALELYGTVKFKEAYRNLHPTSIDYGVLEKARKVYVVIGDFFWDDVGSWHALERIIAKDESGNVKIGNAFTFDVSNASVVNDGKGIIVVYGVSDIVVARSGSRVLILHKDKIDDMRRLIERIKEEPEWKKYL